MGQTHGHQKPIIAEFSCFLVAAVRVGSFPSLKTLKNNDENRPKAMAKEREKWYCNSPGH